MRNQFVPTPSVTGGVPLRGIASLPGDARTILTGPDGQQVASEMQQGSEILKGYPAAILPPPLVASLWHDEDLTVFDHTEVDGGLRISPVSLHDVGGGVYAMLYQGDDAPDAENFLDSRLAFTSNFVDWFNHGKILANPNTGTWEGSRTRANGLIYDDARGEWVLFIGGNGKDHIPGTGTRATGIATSKSITGTYTKFASNPIIHPGVADIQDWGTGSTVNASYTMAVIRYEGTYYAFVMAGDRSQRDYATGILTATNPEGPWSGGAHNPIFAPSTGNWESGQAFPQRPTFVLTEQKWYCPFYNHLGQIGFAISANADPLSSWTKHDSPIIDMPEGRDGMQNIVAPMPGGNWGALIAIGEGAPGADDGTDSTGVRLVTSHIPPSTFPRPVTSLNAAVAARLAASSNLSDVADKPTAAGNLISTQSAQEAMWAKLIENLPTSDPGVANKPWNDSGTLKISPVVAPVISGTGYPGETLTSTVTGQWRRDGVDIAGETGTTYTVTVDDIGVAIDQVALSLDSNNITIWHPADEAGVKLVLLGNTGTLASTGPDVEATQNEDLLQWNDQTVNGYNATQPTAGKRPRKRVDEINGNDAVQFEFVNFDEQVLSGGALGIFQNVGYGYIVAAVRDTLPSGGSALHYVLHHQVGVGTSSRFAIATRFSGEFIALTRRLDDDGSTIAGSAQVAGYNVITGEALWATGTTRLRVNGVQTDTAAMGSSGNTPDTASTAANVGSSGGNNYLPGEIACVIAVSGSAALSAAALARLERYAGLLIGKDIPLA